MIILVTGGRHFSDAPLLSRTLSSLLALHGPFTLIQGGASGADRLAHLWAISNGLPSLTFPADWSRHGRAAGPIRNRQMLDSPPSPAGHRPDLVVAFPGGPGTAHCVQAALSRGIAVQHAEPAPKNTTPEGSGRVWKT